MKKRRNPLAYLRWLGLIGLLALWTDAPPLLVFLLFFFFFAYSAMAPHGLFWANVRRAGRRALAVNLSASCAGMLFLFIRGFHHRLIPPQEKEGFFLVPAPQRTQASIVHGMFAWIFILTVSVFIMTLIHFNRRKNRFTEADRGGNSPC